jgi:hypothetical protein
MPSNDVTHESGDRLDPFLITAAPGVAPRSVAGLEDFLAVPPIPADPAVAEAEAENQAAVTNQHQAVPDVAAAASGFSFDKGLKAADLPILTSFPTQTAEPSAVAGSLGGDDASLIEPPDVLFPNDTDPSGSLASLVVAGLDKGRGGDALSALAANPLDDGLLADASALLSAVPLAGPAVDGGGGSADRFDPWSADSTWSNQAAAVSRFGSGGHDAGSSDSGSHDAWARGDDRSPGGPETLDRIEGRLSQAVAKLEEAVAALSAPGPSSLGSRPRGFRGRIDA